MSQPSTWTTIDPYLDTCPIFVLLVVVVKKVASYKDTVQGSFYH